MLSKCCFGLLSKIKGKLVLNISKQDRFIRIEKFGLMYYAICSYITVIYSYRAQSVGYLPPVNISSAYLGIYSDPRKKSNPSSSFDLSLSPW